MKNNQKEIILLKDLGMKYATEKSNQKRRYGLYKCFCGEEFESQIQKVTNNHTKSCGCLRGVNHKLSNHRLYKTWNGMIQRCTNSKTKYYKNYGLKGICVCDEWLDINNFISDMYPTFKDGLSIDRINNDLGYSKDNCRWADKSLQGQNTRLLRSDNTTGYRGVYKAGEKYKASITLNNKENHLGYFSTVLEAAKVRDQYITDNNLEHTLNFNRIFQ